jgi:regulator of ribonuclease activity A
MTIKTADLCDRFPNEVSVCEPLFRSFGSAESFHGLISTVKVYEDNVLVRQALETLEPGRVLVVDGGGSRRCALLGDNLASLAVSRGLKGIIMYGCVRDSRELRAMDLGILALASHPVRSGKNGAGQSDTPLSFGGIRWVPGHHVYADSDGVITAPESLHEGR